MRKKITMIALAAILGIGNMMAQGVSINESGTAPDGSAMLDVASTTSGVLVPRMTAAQRGAISSPALGLLVYQTDGTAGFYYYDGSSWTQLGGSGSGSSGDDGEMYEYNASGTTSNITVTSSGSFYGWTTATEGVTSGVTFNDNSTADRLTVSTAGDYQVNASVSFGTSTNNTIVEAAVFKNGTKIDYLTFRRKLSSGDLGVAAITGIITLAASDYLDLRFTSDGNGDVVEVEIINLNINQVN